MKGLIVFLTLLCGCAVSTAKLNLHLDGPYNLTMAHRFVYATFEGYDALDKCEFFADNFPKNHERLPQLTKYLRVHLMTEAEVDAAEKHFGFRICAQARAKISVVDVNTYADCEWSETMAHEMLHIVGVPHGADFDQIMDECQLGGSQ